MPARTDLAKIDATTLRDGPGQRLEMSARPTPHVEHRSRRSGQVPPDRGAQHPSGRLLGVRKDEVVQLGLTVQQAPERRHVRLYRGAAILPTTSAPGPLPGVGESTTVSPCSGRIPISARMVRAWVTSTSVPDPRQVDTISFNSRSRAGAFGFMSGTRAHELSTPPTAIRLAVSMQRHTGEDRTRSTRTPWLRKASPSALACSRPRSSKFRCVLQSSALKPGGSPP